MSRQKYCSENSRRILLSKAPLQRTLVGLGRFGQGIAVHQQVLAGAPDQHEVQLLLGHAQKAVGAFTDAIRSYQAAYAIKPDFGDAFWSLANTKTYEFEDREIAHIKSTKRRQTFR